LVQEVDCEAAALVETEVDQIKNHNVSLQVHGLQVALNNKGYYCGEDDCVWWQFGMDTFSSLLTFQV
jgi:hypothetical protein